MPVRVLVQSVKRNIERFPDDFFFELSKIEYESLRSQKVILEKRQKGGYSKYLPYAFTQEGIAMLSSVLRSSRAIQANIAIMKTFVKIREIMISHKDLSEKINKIEKRYDSQFQVVSNRIREIIKANNDNLTVIKKRKIGFGRE